MCDADMTCQAEVPAFVEWLKVGQCRLKGVHPMLTVPGVKRLKLKYDDPLSSFAFDFSLRLYTKSEVKCPSTMVDRITPATSMQDVATLPQTVGVEDAWPVMCEPYRNWVIEVGWYRLPSLSKSV
jgi:hypothetical protein